VPTTLDTHWKKRAWGDRATAGGDATARSLAEETFHCRVYTLSGEANLLTEGGEWVALLGAGGACWSSGGPLNPCGHGEGYPCRRWGEGGASSWDAFFF
jgi:hypothetical protein